MIRILGDPDSSQRGDFWPSQDPLDPQSIARLPDGTIGKVHVFGMKPRTIFYPVEYEVWSYHNVDGTTWLLYLTPKSSPIPSWFRRRSGGSGDPAALVVSEVARYPTGAVF